MDALLYTAGVSMLPLVEQRLGIPLGYAHFDLPILHATAAGIIGNTLAAAIVLWAWPIVARWSRRFPWCDKFLNKLFERTQKHHSKKMQTWGALALIFFVAVPLPGSGGWTGALVAWAFGVPYKKALGLITAGLVIGGATMAALTVGVDGAIQWISGFGSAPAA